MAFKKYSGTFVTEWFPKAASIAMAQGDLVEFSAGTVRPAGTASVDVVGVLDKTVAVTDSDYASTTFVPVTVPVSPNCKWLADTTGSGTLTVGLNFRASGTQGAAGAGRYLDRAANTPKIFLLDRVLDSSGSKVVCKITGRYVTRDGS